MLSGFTAVLSETDRNQTHLAAPTDTSTRNAMTHTAKNWPEPLAFGGVR